MVSSERRVLSRMRTDGSAHNSAFVDTFLRTFIKTHEPHRGTFPRLCRARHVVVFWALYFTITAFDCLMATPSTLLHRTVRMRFMDTT